MGGLPKGEVHRSQWRMVISQQRVIGLTVLVAQLFLGSCGGGSRERKVGRSVRELNLATIPREDGVAPSFGERDTASLGEVLDALREARTDRNVAGLFVRIGSLGGAWGRVADLSAALNAVRAAQKPVHCHFESIDNAGFALAARSCDRITMTPAGDLNTVGVAAQVLFGRSLLESLGVSADLLQVGSFKGAAEPFVRDDMSPELRQTLDGLLDDLQEGFVSAVSEGRRLPRDHVLTVLNEGPFESARAKELGLIDEVEFDNVALEAIKTAVHTSESHPLMGEEDEEFTISDLVEALGEPQDEDSEHTPHVVVASLTGEISDAEDEGRASGSAGPFIRAMREFRDDADVRAVVVRIDSPGGSALASDRMWQAMREVAERKPLIVSVGDMAASGGYYLASAGQDIIAQPNSILGSIGVVGGKISFAAAMERWGVHAETLTRGQNAAWATITRTFSDTERASLQRMMDATYERFLQRIATGREMAIDQIRPHAEGRIFSGTDALEYHLIDRLGTLEDAITLARERAHLPTTSEVRRWPSDRTLFELLALGLGGRTQAISVTNRSPLFVPQHSEAAMVWSVLPPEGRDLATDLVRYSNSGVHVWARMPMVVTIR